MESLLRGGEYEEALEIADSIDWRTEKKIRTLRLVSEIYKINRRYDDAFQTLSIAYDRNPEDPIKRKIVYDLCELSIKMNEYAYAVKFLNEFVKISPKDPGAYMLQYKLYKSQEVPFDERIAVLEEFKQNYFGDFREKWAYELAYLYHATGQSQKCISACDEIILWFVKGPYVTKAMELKMQHVALSPDQQEKYDHRDDAENSEIIYEKPHSQSTEPMYSEPGDEEPSVKIPEEQASPDQAMPIEIRKVDVSNEPTIQIPNKDVAAGVSADKDEVSVNVDKYSTINLQEVLRANLDELQEKTGEPLREKEEKIPEPDPGMTEIKITEPVPEAEEKIKTENVPATETKTEPEAGSDVKTQPVQEKESNFKNILSEDYDGQISLNVPDMPPEIEKQITGQIDINTVIAQWDQLKKESTEKRINNAKRKSLEQTNDIAKALEGVIPGFKVREMPEEIKNDETVPAEKSILPDDPDDFEEIQDIEDDREITFENGPEPEQDQPEQTEEISQPEQPEETEEIEDSEEPAEDEKSEDSDIESVQDDQEAGEAEKHKIPEPVDIKEFDEDEKEIFAEYTSMHGMADVLVDSLKNISMTACKGNIVITGNEENARLGLASAFAKEEQLKNPLFTGKIAKISAEIFNSKDIVKSLNALDGGVLVIEKAGDLSEAAMGTLGENLRNPELAILLIMEDEKGIMKSFSKKYDWFDRVFGVKIEIPTYTNDDLVLHGREYAREKEYTIDELGILALYRRIADRQTAAHVVTADEVDEILDQAIAHVNKKNVGHLMDVLFAKRYNDEDLIILREKDFEE